MQTTESQAQPTDLLIGLTRGQLDDVGLALAKVDRQGNFIYGNRAMCDILGVQAVEGLTIADVFKGEDLLAVREHLASRFSKGASDEYEVCVTRPGDGARVPIRCSAMPDRDERGEIVGAIAIIRDLLADDVLRKVNEAVQDLRDGFEILEAVARQCQRIVPFDAFGVTLYSVDGEHARQFYVWPVGQFRPSVRWNEMSSYAKALVAENDVVNVPDFEQWLDQPQWRRYRDEPDMQQVLKLGFASSLSFPVVSGKQVVATIGFARLRAGGPFLAHEEDSLRRMPLGSAVRMALHYYEVGELAFAPALMRKIAAGPASTTAIAATLVEALWAHYEWENVSIFRPDELTGHMVLVCQPEKTAFRLPEGYRHALDQGVTGRVYRTATALNIPDVKAPEFKDLYLAGFSESCSELCLPVIVSGRVYWILNVEDAKRNAFAREEQQNLEGILREVAVMLELVVQTQMFAELLRCSKDAVIQTDYRGAIVQTNPATAELLGYDEAEMKGTALATYFKDEGQARCIEEARYVPNDEVHLLRKDGTEVSLLLSGTSLPSEIGRKVYVCNDLSSRKRTETLEILRQMFNEIAVQIKTPLALAFTWLARLHELGLPPRAAELTDKTLKQLEKVDLTFDRLLFYQRHASIVPVQRMVFDIPEVLGMIKQQLPDSEAAQVEITVDPGIPPVRGNIYQIGFCIESLLAYLLRFVPETGKVTIGISRDDAGVNVLIAGRAPEVSGGVVADYAATNWAISAITELAFGEAMVRRFIVTDHGGTFDERLGDDGRTEFLIVLPGALTEGPA